MPDAAESGGRRVPKLSVRTRYVKDLSFENPNAPRSLRPERGAPAIGVDVGVDARSLGHANYEVSLGITATASHDGTTLFVVELKFAGIFLIRDFPPERVEPVCMVECPRLLFPFARRVIAEATRDGGFAPLLLAPIDFSALYHQRRTGGDGGEGTVKRPDAPFPAAHAAPHNNVLN